MSIFFPEYCDFIRFHKREFEFGLRILKQINSGFLNFDELLRILYQYRRLRVPCAFEFCLEIGELHDRLKEKVYYDLVDLEITLIGLAFSKVRLQ